MAEVLASGDDLFVVPVAVVFNHKQ
jgi:hypothetical protein